MVQVLATIFFSAAALGALGIIVAMIADNFADVRLALRLVPAPIALPPARVRVRRVSPGRAPSMAPAAAAARAAA